MLFAFRTWSNIGITTTIKNNNNVECLTEHLTTFALLSSTSICDVEIRDIDKSFLRATSYTILSVSLLFLLASIVTFLVSWRKVFRIDINVMNFNHSITLCTPRNICVYICNGIIFRTSNRLSHSGILMTFPLDKCVPFFPVHLNPGILLNLDSWHQTSSQETFPLSDPSVMVHISCLGYHMGYIWNCNQ